MKLADSWVEEPSPPAPAMQLYEELDESKHGCGGVCWWKYVLKEPSTSNKMLHQLARAVRGVEVRRGKALTLTQYKMIYGKWEVPSRRFLREGHDYFTEFLAKLSLVTMPEGETLESAFQRSHSRQPPSKALLVPNKGLAINRESLRRASRDVWRPAHHAMPNGHCEAVQSFTADYLGLDSCVKNSARAETGRTCGKTGQSSEILFYRVKPAGNYFRLPFAPCIQYKVSGYRGAYTP